MASMEEVLQKLFSYVTMSTTLKEPLATTQVCNADLIGGPLLQYSLIALMGSIFFALVIYLISRILEDRREESFAKGEIREVIITLVILLTITALVQLPCAKYPDPITQRSLDSYQRAFYMLQSVDFTLRILIVYLQYPYFYVSLLNFTVKAFGTKVNAFQGIYGLLKPLFTQNVTLLTLADTVQMSLIFSFDALTYGTLVYLVPIGIFLRSFYLTRKVGGAILGLAITMGIIYPVVMGLFYPLEDLIRPPGISVSPSGSAISADLQEFEDLYKNSPVNTQGAPTPTDVMNVDQYIYDLKQQRDNSVRDFFGLSNNVVATSVLAGILHKIAKALNLGFLLKNALLLVAIIGGVALPLGLIITAVSYAFIFAFLFPVLVSIIITTSGRFVSQLLGQELDLGNLTRLV